MATTIEQIETPIEEATATGFRGRLLARGQARAIIWRDGELPEGAPEFDPRLSYDLLSYGYSLLGMGLRLTELGGSTDAARLAFERAADALEAVISKGDPKDEWRGFYRLSAAAAYHLGRFSARSYSLLVDRLQDINISPAEKALCRLMLRNFDDLLSEIISFRLEGPGTDQNLTAQLVTEWELPLEDETLDPFDGIGVIDLALTDNYLGAIGAFLLAVETGNTSLVELAQDGLADGLNICEELNLVSQWWVHRLTIHLIDGLWASTFHEVLPNTPSQGENLEWEGSRRLFLALLCSRKRSEMELWPSQLEGATRAADQSDDLVVSLPTSAGKTRIAELCILRCLAEGKRVVFVTPLRALSAQTEISLRQTFLPLGRSVSTLYGSIGTSDLERDVLRTRDIVVSTPEKLDFALRNDPSILDDVGLVVLDEGHMIGIGEREIRYEVQVQRLLHRDDAAERRIVCLSAVLPDTDQFNDFVDWLRNDAEGEAIQGDWRPTRLRYGEVTWNNDRARLDLRIDAERPFIPNFLTAVVPTTEMIRGGVGLRRLPYPNNQRELVMATTWRLVEEGQTVLIYCPERRSVERYAKDIVDLYRRGLLDPVVDEDSPELTTATAIGEEWLGGQHPIVQCLHLGVAVHHGALPTPFRKEVERLLRSGVLRITVSSPTLAQGLNLSATAIVMHDIEAYDVSAGSRRPIRSEVFQNIVGRAGRAFVDIEGMVVFPIFDRVENRRTKWEELITAAQERELESGLVRLVATLLGRIYRAIDADNFEEVVEYIVNTADAWEFKPLDGEDDNAQATASKLWHDQLASLDTAILSLLGEEECEVDALAAKLDDVLTSSFWARRIAKIDEAVRAVPFEALAARAQYIWENSDSTGRRGYFLAGLGLASGHLLDEISEQANLLLLRANGAIVNGDQQLACETILELAELILRSRHLYPSRSPIIGGIYSQPG